MANITLGPVLGFSSTSAVNVLVEVSTDASLELVLSPQAGVGAAGGGDIKVAGSAKANIPLVLHAEGLDANVTYTVQVVGAENSDDPSRIGSVRLGCSNADLAANVAVASCNKIAHTKGADLDKDMWQEMVDTHARMPFSLILHMGDQVYADAEEEKEESSYRRARTLVIDAIGDGELTDAIRGDLRPRILELYRDCYRETWSHPPTAQMLRTVPSVSQLDDHEIFDDAGDVKEHSDPATIEFYIASCARTVYYEYQRQLWDPTVLERHERGDVDTDFHAHFIGDDVAIMCLDVRGAGLWYDRAESAANRGLLGETQWKQFTTMVRSCRARSIILCTPIPMVLFSPEMIKLVGFKSDDVRGMWDHADHRAERDDVLATLMSWEEADPARSLVIAAGDIHMGGFCNITRGDRGNILQLTASSVSNNHPTSIGAVIARTSIQTSGKLPGKDISFNHSPYFAERNFGSLQFAQVGSKVEAFLHKTSGVISATNIRDNSCLHGCLNRIFTCCGLC